MSDGITEMQHFNGSTINDWNKQNINHATASVRASIGSLNTQVDGKHYKHLKIQPVEYIHANNIPFIEGSIIKYATRWRDKGGLKDIEKIKHFCDLLIELENKKE